MSLISTIMNFLESLLMEFSEIIITVDEAAERKTPENNGNECEKQERSFCEGSKTNSTNMGSTLSFSASSPICINLLCPT